jgi:flagellum-specific peptidoglycan hydrolase FlgJ
MSKELREAYRLVAADLESRAAAAVASGGRRVFIQSLSNAAAIVRREAGLDEW